MITKEDKILIYDDAIDQRRRRLSACVDAEGGFFEHHPGLQSSHENSMLVF